MRLVHFFPRSAKKAFLNRFASFLSSYYGDNYKCYDKTDKLKSFLNSRSNYTDFVVITAHGSEEYIFGDKVKGIEQKLDINDLSCLKNSFIFAFACSTSSLGKQVCERHNALAYIGFKQDIKLTVTGGYSNELNIILRDMYSKALIDTFAQLETRIYCIHEFVLLIRKNMELQHSKIISSKPDELSHLYSLELKVVQSKEFLLRLKTNLLTTISYVCDVIEYHGEGSLFPWFYILKSSPERLPDIAGKLEKANVSFNKMYYKHFLLALIYQRIGDKKKAHVNLNECRKLFKDYGHLSESIVADFPAASSE